MFTYCGNNPVVRSDDEGKGWWAVACAIIGGIVGAATKVASNVTTGKKWNDGIIGASIGGAAYGGVLAATGNIVTAGYVGGAAEAVVNESLSYSPLAKKNGTSRKTATSNNIANSIGNVAVNTAVNGTISAVTGKVASKVVPTNNGWFKPQKFKSSFTGKYAVKSDLQTVVQGGLMYSNEALNYSYKQRENQGQQSTITFFPDTEISMRRY